MNTRIQELAKQAGFDLVKAETAHNGHILPNSLSRFYQGILKECIATLKNNGYDDAAEQLKKSFGDE